MRRPQKRLLALFGSLAVLLVASALLYMVGMGVLEGTPRGFWDSLSWAAETLSTTGYGADSSWHNPAMVIFVVLVQFAGVFFVFLVFPVYLIPALEERFQGRLPDRIPPEVEDGVLIYGYGPAVATLIDELEGGGLHPVIVEADEAVARRLHARGRRVVFTAEGDGLLDRFDLSRVRAIVANSKDDENAALALAARSAGFKGEILALVEEPHHRKALTVAGANRVFTPRHLLAAALAARASERISPRVVGAQALGRKLVVSEVKIGSKSPLAGTSLKGADVGRRTGVTVIGLWRRGELVAPVEPAEELEPDTILIVVGSGENVARFAETCSAGGVRLGGPFLVAGYGEVGRTVAQILRSVGERVVTLDEHPGEGIDVAGDVADPRVLEACGLRDARAVILAVGSDSATLFAALVIKEFAPDIPVIARVNQAENIERIHRAGADFALSISQVSGQLLAARLLGREEIMVDPDLKVVRMSSQALAGSHPAELAIRERTGASIVAIERGDEVIVALEPEFTFREEDVVYVCGDEEAIQSFQTTFAASNPQSATRRRPEAAS